MSAKALPGEAEVPIDAITEFECEEDEDGSEDTE